MSTRRLAVVFSSLCVAAALCLSGCASSDMKKDDFMQKPMIKDSGKTMDDKMNKHDDMNGSM